MNTLKDTMFVKDTCGTPYVAEKCNVPFEEPYYRIVVWEPFIGSHPVNTRPVKRPAAKDLPAVYYTYGDEWVFIPF